MGSFTRCPGCGLEVADRHLPVAGPYHASGECLELYHRLVAENLGRPDPAFVHQHCVDAYAAQHVGERTKPITSVFALAGLYLAVERGFTGRQVQKAHVELARRAGRRIAWPRLDPRPYPWALTVLDVLQAGAGEARALAIKRWAQAAWEGWAHEHEHIRDMCRRWIL
ncbi:serine/threonine protein kinase [Thermaerobacter sp. PB12/4term]|uniref:DUF5946 family protein n=1 Tax=Thermaerobacter sp. PB12/4term TaxID=2293838 RepID=UPI000E3268CE|nr:DUF5946 family protein [Thermaerobacter sp. PB12/4term]QIA27918.1 serine/threonine protein kinase [Thermaerobacter sp. PB12/4term]